MNRTATEQHRPKINLRGLHVSEVMDGRRKQKHNSNNPTAQSNQPSQCNEMIQEKHCHFFTEIFKIIHTIFGNKPRGLGDCLTCPSPNHQTRMDAERALPQHPKVETLFLRDIT